MIKLFIKALIDQH